jgi:HAD superfamily phosphoserine phosphatase-like hydrolase
MKNLADLRPDLVDHVHRSEHGRVPTTVPDLAKDHRIWWIMYKLFLFDMDGVLLQHKSSFQYCQEAIGCDCRWFYDLVEGDLIYDRHLNRLVLQKMIDHGFTKDKLLELARNAPQMKGIGDVLNAIEAHRGSAVIISGGIGAFAQELKKQYAFASYISNELHFERPDQPPTWEIRCGHSDKGKIARSFQAALGISREETFAVGDYSNDCTMFSEAGLSIAFNGNDDAKAAATCSIESEDLSDILPLVFGNAGSDQSKVRSQASLCRSDIW